MALVHELVSKHLPIRRRVGSKGWITCNAVCCHHRGHRQDNRSRGNFLFTPEGMIVYNCYNCGFRTRFDGSKLSRNFEGLMDWLGVPMEDIKKVKLELMHSRLDGEQCLTGSTPLIVASDFKEVQLPTGAVPLESLITEDDLPDDFMDVLTYLGTRGSAVMNGWNYHWSPSTKWDMNKRIIIPFYYRNKIVGWTARYAGTPPGETPRYYNSDVQTGYLFNCDVLYKHTRSFVTVHEGPFDAISIDGVATLGSELSREQIAWLNNCDMQKIVVPDRQLKNQGLIDSALANGWSVSFPEWEEDIKDSADATKRYGKLFTLSTIMRSHTKNELEIGIKRRMFK